VAFQSLLEENGVWSAEGTVLFVASHDIGERISATLPTSPDLTSCNFYLCGCVKDQVYQPPMLQSLLERISQAAANADESHLRRTWKEFEYRVFFLSFLGWGKTWVHLVRRPLTGLLYQSRMIDDECGAVGGMRIGMENRSTRRKSAPTSLCPQQIPHDLTWARTRAAAVGSRRLTAWAMARPVALTFLE
jgi:hypothetical protein